MNMNMNTVHTPHRHRHITHMTKHAAPEKYDIVFVSRKIRCHVIGVAGDIEPACSFSVA